MLETSKSKTVLIGDASLPAAEPGKIYLYNTEKKAIIEYVVAIVEKKIRILTDTELADMKKKYHRQWLVSKSAFVKKRGRVASRSAVSKESNINAILSDVDATSFAIDEEFDDL